MTSQLSVADPGFSIGGVDPLGGHGPLTWAFFAKNVCKNKRIGSRRGRAPGTPPRSPDDYDIIMAHATGNVFFRIRPLIYSCVHVVISALFIVSVYKPSRQHPLNLSIMNNN